MSTLTKVLIVLLSLFSIFLCGAVVTYVGSANNYRAQAQKWQGLYDAAKETAALKTRQYNDKQAEMEQLQTKLNTTIQQLQDQNAQLAVDLRNAEREMTAYQQKSESWKGLITSFQQTIENIEQSRDLIAQQLDEYRQSRIEDSKRLNEIQARIYELTLQREQLEKERRRILEQKNQLEDRLQTIASGAPTASAAETYQPVTQVPGAARPAFDGMTDAGEVTGVITEVSEDFVTISVGSADGVRKDMVFHAYRGGNFLCDIVIFDVDTNVAAGSLELVQQRPKIGDTVSTSL